ELAAEASGELLGLRLVVAIPMTQVGARGDLLDPDVHLAGVFGDSARPDAIDEDPVRPRRRVGVGTLDRHAARAPSLTPSSVSVNRGEPVGISGLEPGGDQTRPLSSSQVEAMSGVDFASTWLATLSAMRASALSAALIGSITSAT